MCAVLVSIPAGEGAGSAGFAGSDGNEPGSLSGLLSATWCLFRSSGPALRAPHTHPPPPPPPRPAAAGGCQENYIDSVTSPGPRDARGLSSTMTAATVAVAPTSSRLANVECSDTSPAARKPSGPGAEIAIVTLASTRARSSGGAAVVIAAKKRG